MFDANDRIIAIAADHAGFELKEVLKRFLADNGHTVLDFGTDGPDSVDYPDFADAVSAAIAAGQARRGVLICGSGIGISIAANRHRHIRAALCTDAHAARMARAHNDANVLALGARTTPVEVAHECLTAFLTTDYEGGRHDRRLAKLGGLPPT